MIRNRFSGQRPWREKDTVRRSIPHSLPTSPQPTVLAGIESYYQRTCPPFPIAPHRPQFPRRFNKSYKTASYKSIAFRRVWKYRCGAISSRRAMIRRVEVSASMERHVQSGRAVNRRQYTAYSEPGLVSECKATSEFFDTLPPCRGHCRSLTVENGLQNQISTA